MKQINRRFNKAGILIAITGVVACGVWVWQKQNSILPTTIPTLTPRALNGNDTLNLSKSFEDFVKSDFGEPDNWPYFNQNYQHPKRSFRFQYPPQITVDDHDSGKVWLEYNLSGHETNLSVIGIEQIYPLTEFTVGNYSTIDKQFKAYYFYLRAQYTGNWYTDGNYPDLSFERIDFGSKKFFYKVTENDNKEFLSMNSNFPDLKNDRYIGVVNGYGIEIVALKELSEDVVHNIIQSVEFR